ncbi:MAG: YkuS family protein [Chitinophagales bacterium]
MGKGVVAVASELGNVAARLKAAGYTVVSLQGTDLGQVGAVVVSGVSDDLMGIQTTVTKAPVIDANGLTEEEILETVSERLDLQ